MFWQQKTKDVLFLYSAFKKLDPLFGWRNEAHWQSYHRQETMVELSV